MQIKNQGGMEMRKNVLLWIIGAALLFGAPTLSFAGTWTSGTTAGVDIISGGNAGATATADVAGDVVATFKVGSSGTKTATCVVATVTVGQIYGGKWGTLTADQQGLPAAMVDYEYQLINMGNATDNFTLNATGLPSGWTASMLKNGGTISDLSVAEDAMSTFTVRVTIPDSANDNATGVIVVTANSMGSDGAEYTVEPWQYGGADSLTDSATTTCSSAIIALTKAAQVGTATGYNGLNANVPGSLVTYCLEYHNNGSANATDVTVTDMIPSHTTYVANSIKMGTVGDTYTVATSKDDNASDESAPCANWNATVTGAVTFNLGIVAAGTSGRLYYQVRID